MGNPLTFVDVDPRAQLVLEVPSSTEEISHTSNDLNRLGAGRLLASGAAHRGSNSWTTSSLLSLAPKIFSLEKMLIMT